MYKYEHGGIARYTKKNILDFSANINPLGLQEGVREAITAVIDDCTFYPDSFSTELRNKISAYEAVSSSQIVCGNGASELIFRMVYALKPKKALVLAPSFADYSRALRAVNCKIYQHQLYEENNFKLGRDILDIIKKERFDLVFLCNPNNPTGVLIERGLAENIIDECEKTGACILIDECFLDLIQKPASYTVKGLIQNYPNMVVLKAFTKVFALPGIRLGYALCSNEELLNAIYFHGPDWSVSTLAQAAGIAALRNPDKYLESTRKFIRTEKENIVSELKKMRFHIFGSTANYIFFKNPYTVDLADELYRNHDISIRSCRNYVGLDERFYRIAVLASENNQKLIQAMKSLKSSLPSIPSF